MSRYERQLPAAHAIRDGLDDVDDIQAEFDDMMSDYFGDERYDEYDEYDWGFDVPYITSTDELEMLSHYDDLEDDRPWDGPINDAGSNLPPVSIYEPPK